MDMIKRSQTGILPESIIMSHGWNNPWLLISLGKCGPSIIGNTIHWNRVNAWGKFWRFTSSDSLKNPKRLFKNVLKRQDIDVVQGSWTVTLDPRCSPLTHCQFPFYHVLSISKYQKIWFTLSCFPKKAFYPPLLSKCTWLCPIGMACSEDIQRTTKCPDQQSPMRPKGPH